MRIPILKLNGILVTSIQVDLTDDEALEFQNDALSAAAAIEAKGFIIDITALDVVDTYLARVINDTANMLNLVGTEVVICGMQPSVALTLVEMGRELIGVRTALDLDQGMENLKILIAKRDR